MSTEISLDFDSDRWDSSSFPQNPVSELNYSEKIFTSYLCPSVSKKGISLEGIDLPAAKRIDEISKSTISPMDVNGSAELNIKAEWGGKDGTKVSVGATGELQDNRGNFTKGEIRQDSTGQGSVSVSGGHKNDKPGQTDK